MRGVAHRRGVGLALLTGAVTLAALSGLAGPAAPASAHSTNGGLPDAPYYRSTVLAVEPAVQGLGVVLERAGETITLTNDTGRVVEVPGYSGEPYLRFTASGVEENTNSLSSFLNGTLVIQGLPQQSGPAAAPPAWRQVSTTHAYSWHDHRLHWMAQQRPPVVAADPTAAHTVFDWTVPLTVDGAPVVIRGRLTWIGEPLFSGLRGSLYVIGASAALLVVGLVVARVAAVRRRAAGVPAPAAGPTQPGADPVRGPR